MKIHFAASLNEIQERIGAYADVVSIIKSSGHELVRDWLDSVQKDGTLKTEYGEAEWKKISEQTLDSVIQADVVIIEASSPSFSLGYQAAIALTHKKPLLVLFHKGSEIREMIYDPSYSLMEVRIYDNRKDISSIVKTFIDMNDIDSKDMRFNMFLDRESYTYLNWESTKTGKTKAQIIREIIKKNQEG